MAFKELSEKGVYSMSLTTQDEKYFYVEIRALKPGVNRNEWDFTLEGIKKNGKTFVGQPLLIAYVNGKIGDGHNYDLTLNPLTGELQEDFRGGDAERIVGEITSEVRVEESAGETWLILPARIWKFYAQQLVDYIIQTKSMDVSVEVEVADGYEVREDGVEVFTEWTGLGVTILGQGVTPAVEGARLRALAASEEYKEMRLKAASYVPKNNTTLNKGGLFVMNESLKKVLSTAMAEYGTLLGFSTDGKYASVYRKNGVPAFYPCADFNENDGVIQSKFIDACIVLSAEIANGEETETITCNTAGIIEAANADAETAKAEAEKAKSECEAAKAECATAKERIAALEKAEADRKLAEMTKAFDDVVKAHNLTACAEERITDEEVNVIHNAINEGKFTDSEQVIGEFKKMAYDKHVANTKKDTKKLAWNFNDGTPAPTGEDAVIASFIASGEN